MNPSLGESLLSPVIILAGIVLGPAVVQFGAYFLFARFALQVATKRSLGIAAVRVILGVVLFTALVAVTIQETPHVGGLLAVSATISWAVVAMMDPRRSWHRFPIWVLGGTVLTLVVNEAFWRLLTGEGILSMDTHWSFG